MNIGIKITRIDTEKIMKNNNYETPAIEVIEIEIEDAALSDSETSTTSGLELNIKSGSSFSD